MARVHLSWTACHRQCGNSSAHAVGPKPPTPKCLTWGPPRPVAALQGAAAGRARGGAATAHLRGRSMAQAGESWFQSPFFYSDLSTTISNNAFKSNNCSVDAACVAGDPNLDRLRQAAVILSHPVQGHFCSVGRPGPPQGAAAELIPAAGVLRRRLGGQAAAELLYELRSFKDSAGARSSRHHRLQGTLIKRAEDDPRVYVITAWHCLASHGPGWAYTMDQYAGGCERVVQRHTWVGVRSWNNGYNCRRIACCYGFTRTQKPSRLSSAPGAPRSLTMRNQLQLACDRRPRCAPAVVLNYRLLDCNATSVDENTIFPNTTLIQARRRGS